MGFCVGCKCFLAWLALGTYSLIFLQRQWGRGVNQFFIDCRIACRQSRLLLVCRLLPVLDVPIAKCCFPVLYWSVFTVYPAICSKVIIKPLRAGYCLLFTCHGRRGLKRKKRVPVKGTPFSVARWSESGSPHPDKQPDASRDPTLEQVQAYARISIHAPQGDKAVIIGSVSQRLNESPPQRLFSDSRQSASKGYLTPEFVAFYRRKRIVPLPGTAGLILAFRIASGLFAHSGFRIKALMFA